MQRLETPRLTLRPYRAEDLDNLAGLYGDPEVSRFTKLGRLDRAQSQATLDGYLEHWRDKGYGIYAVHLKENGAFAGEGGFFTLQDWNETALRYALHKRHWGGGLATELAGALIGHAFATLGFARLVSVVERDNAASHHIMAKLGLTLERRVRVPKTEICVYALSRAAWRGGGA